MAIGASTEYIKHVDKTFIKPATTPDVLRSRVLPARKEINPVDAARISNNLELPKAEKLNLHPEKPVADETRLPFQQTAGSDLLFHCLGVGEYSDLRPLAGELRAENKVLGK